MYKIICIGATEKGMADFSAIMDIVFDGDFEVQSVHNFRSTAGKLDVPYFVGMLRQAHYVIFFGRPAEDVLMPLGAALWGIEDTPTLITTAHAEQLCRILLDGNGYAHETDPDTMPEQMAIVDDAMGVLRLLKKLHRCQNREPDACEKCEIARLCNYYRYVVARNRAEAAFALPADVDDLVASGEGE